MLVLQGKSALGSIAIGSLQIYHHKDNSISQEKVEDVEAEIERFHQALREAEDNLKNLYQKAKNVVGEEDAAIFQAQELMLTDPDYVGSVEEFIRTNKNRAEAAVKATALSFENIFAGMEDSYMQARAADVQDVSRQLINVLIAEEEGTGLKGKIILGAKDLTPSETMNLDKNKVLAFVTTKGSLTSHAAILAKTLGIPAVVGVGKEIISAYQGKYTIVDGFTGTVYIDPDEKTIRLMKEKIEKNKVAEAALEEVIGKPSVTKEGKNLQVYANISSPRDLVHALHNDAEGIGLFRSEFLYLERDNYPTEDEQFEAYKAVLSGMRGKKVIIRTLDIGADKQVSYFQMPEESNPALGLRAIRICLARPDIFKPQLRALLRASAYGNLGIMLPMIVSVEEITRTRSYIDEIKTELATKRIPYNPNVQLGIMVETPAAALISAELAKEVDFFSIGTNDLIQYTMAMDRQDERMEKLVDTHHPAILKLMKMIVDSAHEAGIRCGICGEMGSDLSMLENYIKWGVDEVSVTPGFVLNVRKRIREL
ncbi:MAG: phosphoenolpyruvate--protein phosphotransferase [Acidaminococcaceae bacterium]|jgi:phosphotransferase system enzyme I (PtsI)|nr:phosphoenolpyruvate--protein phosphotransferase [Acidaminococcaceae bacterium]